jgi:hypothetical protein
MKVVATHISMSKGPYIGSEELHLIYELEDGTYVIKEGHALRVLPLSSFKEFHHKDFTGASRFGNNDTML